MGDAKGLGVRASLDVGNGTPSAVAVGVLRVAVARGLRCWVNVFRRRGPGQGFALLDAVCFVSLCRGEACSTGTVLARGISSFAWGHTLWMGTRPELVGKPPTAPVSGANPSRTLLRQCTEERRSEHPPTSGNPRAQRWVKDLYKYRDIMLRYPQFSKTTGRNSRGLYASSLLLWPSFHPLLPAYTCLHKHIVYPWSCGSCNPFTSLRLPAP